LYETGRRENVGVKIRSRAIGERGEKVAEALGNSVILGIDQSWRDVVDGRTDGNEIVETAKSSAFLDYLRGLS
jgi:hypothetical protein